MAVDAYDICTVKNTKKNKQLSVGSCFKVFISWILVAISLHGINKPLLWIVLVNGHKMCVAVVVQEAMFNVCCHCIGGASFVLFY